MTKNRKVLIVIDSTILSYSNDNTKESSSNEPISIVGKWVLGNQIYDSQNESLSDCERLETLTFNSNGPLISYYTHNDPCIFFTKKQQYSLNGTELTFLFSQNSDFKFNALTLATTAFSIENFNRSGEIFMENNSAIYDYEKSGLIKTRETC